MRPASRGAASAAALAAVSVVSFALLLSACGGKEEAPAPPRSPGAAAAPSLAAGAAYAGIAGAVAYDGVPSGAVRGAILRGGDFYNLQFLLSSGLILDVFAGMAIPASGMFDVAWSGLKSSEMQGHVSLMVSGAPNGGSPRDSRSRVEITVFANGDSVRAVGHDIELENGSTISFDVKSCTDPEECPID